MKIKICGLKTMTAARAAKEAGADFLGFILWPGSSRYIEPGKAADLVRGLAGGATTVGVVVDQPLEEVISAVRHCGFDAIQLHGHEPPDYAKALREKADVRIIKAYRWRDDFSAEIANAYPADYLLLDTFRKGMAGGTGEAFPWREAAAETKKIKKPLLLAGGISAENAGKAMKALSPFGLDVSGSLEVNGEKSTEKIREFMQKIKEIRNEATS